MSVFYQVSSEGEATEEGDSGSAQASASETAVQTEAQMTLSQFWPKVTDEIRKIGMLDLKNQALPLARIKKIMKLDEDVKMISAEAPMLFAKAAEIFINELTLRAWVHTEDNKRRTLQRNDIAMAISKCDQFDFLIDIVPREELKPAKATSAAMNPDQIQYYFHLAQQHQQALQQTGTSSASTSSTSTSQPQPTIQILQPGTGQIQTVQVASIANSDQATSSTSSVVTAQRQQTSTTTVSSQPQVIQIQQPAQQQVQAQAVQPSAAGIQIVQQVVSPTGEIQQIPIQLTPAQLQMIQMRLQGNTAQPTIIQLQPQLVQVSSDGFVRQNSSGGGDVE